MMDVRQTPRVPVRCPCGFSSVQIAGEGTVVNLSSKGCAVESSTPVSSETYLEVWILTPDRSFAAIVDVAVVVWSGDERFGMKFLRVRPEDESKIGAIVQRFPHNPEGAETRRSEPASLLVLPPESVPPRRPFVNQSPPCAPVCSQPVSPELVSQDRCGPGKSETLAPVAVQ